MSVLLPHNGVYVFHAWQHDFHMLGPFIEAVRVVLLQIKDQPGQVLPIRQQILAGSRGDAVRIFEISG